MTAKEQREWAAELRRLNPRRKDLTPIFRHGYVIVEHALFYGPVLPNTHPTRLVRVPTPKRATQRGGSR